MENVGVKQHVVQNATQRFLCVAFMCDVLHKLYRRQIYK